jgi:hypothetical protein
LKPNKKIEYFIGRPTLSFLFDEHWRNYKTFFEKILNHGAANFGIEHDAESSSTSKFWNAL